MMVDPFIFDVIRLLTGVLLLGYASYTDMKTRRAANILWVIMGIIGAVLIAIQYFDGGIQNIWYLAFIPVMMLLMYVFFQMRLLFGGADAKALMALAILLPFQPSFGMDLPLWLSYFPGSWVTFANSAFIFLLIPLSLLVFNIAHRNLKFPHALLGYVITIEKAKQTFVWPMEKIKDGKRKLVKLPKDYDVDEELREFEKLGIKEIWVTPKIPFMIPLLIGFILTFFLGDILVHLINAFTALF